MMTMLRGKKTYIVAALMLLVGLVHGLTGDATGWAILWDNAQIILTGAGLAGLRAGVG
tara:strand:- start:91 stop:264 length:174 start_codon:yes stop_codon:yes gene_type:complete